MAGNDRLEETHRALDQIAQGPEPESVRDLIHAMDAARLGIRDNLVILM